LLLIRHGAVGYSGREGGAGDGLSTLGEMQARALARRLATREAGAVYTSSVRRSVETAEIVGEHLGSPIKVEPRLDPRPAAAPGMQAAALSACEDIVFAHPGRELAVVTHGPVIAALLRDVLGMPPGEGPPFIVDHCSLSVVEYEGGRAIVRSFNDTAHLEELASWAG
jgi:broad specificity phosphatase PhoE